MRLKWIFLAAMLLPVCLRAGGVTAKQADQIIADLVQHVTPEQYAAMAKLCDVRDKQFRKEYRGAEIPAEFAVLGCERVSLSWGCCDIYFDVKAVEYAFLRIDTSARNQIARMVVWYYGGQRQKVVWIKDPAAEEPFHPKGRVLTVHVTAFGFGSELVITESVIMAIRRNGLAGGQDEIVAQRKLTPSEVQWVKDAIGRIPRDAFGKVYWATNILDGGGMTFGFSSDGEPSPKDIVLANAWCGEVAELTKIVQKLAPEGIRVPNRKSLSDPQAKVEVYPIDQFRSSELAFWHEETPQWPEGEAFPDASRA